MLHAGSAPASPVYKASILTIGRMEQIKLDFESLISIFKIAVSNFIIPGAGFEPTKRNAMAFETIPFDHLGNLVTPRVGFEPTTFQE